MKYDLIIIGGSAAATTAGIYAARRNLNFKIIAKDFGGEVATSGEIGNWPGMDNTTGLDLAERFRKHLEFYKVDMQDGVAVQSIRVQPDGSFCVSTRAPSAGSVSDNKLATDGSTAPVCDYEAKAIILTTGVHPRALGIPGEAEFRNKGVTYCTVCDGPLFGGKQVAVVGGGNSALEAALMLADIATKVYVVNKNASFKGEQVLIDNLKTKANVEVISNAETTEIMGTKFVEGLQYKDAQGAMQKLAVEGVFVHIGMVPNSYMAPTEVTKDAFGQIKVNAMCETNIPGFYAAGDVTDVAYKQIVIATGQGCIALLSAVGYLNRIQQ